MQNTQGQVKQLDIKENLAIKAIIEADSLMEEIDELLNKQEEPSDKQEEQEKINYDELVEACSDGFGGKYIFND